ncbi:MAG: hypothetical protein E3K32_02795 [wastewater metagenome]|nr:hypothetical protein [Candidatus Loosdrechtia aerotolerans]
MNQLRYMLIVCITVGWFIILNTHSSKAASAVTDDNTSLANSAKESSEEIHMKADEFNEIVEQLQGMKAFLEQMKQDYDARFQEMQEKIAILEREKALLEKEKALWRIETQTGTETSPHTADFPTIQETGVSKEDEGPFLPSFKEEEEPPDVEQQPLPPQTEMDTTPPSPFPAIPELATPQTTTPQTPTIPETGQWSPAQPITLWSAGAGYMNISFVGLFAAAASTSPDLDELEAGAHDPIQRGFTVQNLETVFEGAVDPYFKGQANIIFQIDEEGESFLEVEEAYLTTLSLPLNLQVKAGTFFTEFGRLNQLHPHAWNFVDQPLVIGRFLSPDGLRNPGARISWLAPADIYTELFLTVQNSQGETVRSFRFEEDGEGLFGRSAVETKVRSMEDLLYVPRMVTSFDITEEQTVLLGASAAFGPNSTGRDKDTIIYGIDMFWKWKSKYASGGFPFLAWQTEVLRRHFEAGEDESAGLPDEVIRDWGAYSEVTWGFKNRWVAGLRGDYVEGEKEATSPLGFERWRLSPNITFYPSEFSKIRLQYNYDSILSTDDTEHSVFLQFEFLLGSHGAHTF